MTLHLRLRVPDDLLDDFVEALTGDEAVSDVVVQRDVVVKPAGHLVECDVAREHASALVEDLGELDPDRQVSLTIEEPVVVLSQTARDAEEAVRGRPEDGVVWEEVESGLREDASLSWSFVAFLTLATLLAGVGRLLDQPILIVGSMVVGPEFAPLAAISYAVARPRLGMLRPAATTLAVGAGVALAVAYAFWWVASALGYATERMATSGAQTDFIVSPNGWSLVVAVLAGAAGVLSLTTEKSGALVGVFISVTTVPALGTAALTLATGAYPEAAEAGAQLGINVLGILLAGVVTLAAQRAWWRWRGTDHPRTPAHVRRGRRLLGRAVSR